MRVLVACEESQAVCQAFRDVGADAYSCDVIPCSGGHPEWHIKDDVLNIMTPNVFDCNDYLGFKTEDGVFHYYDGGWDLIVAHPPCTYLSNAGACRLYPQKGVLDVERYRKGLEAKEFFMKMLNAPCPHVAVENPMPSRIFDLPPHTQEIQPWMFGHPYTKKTRLWLRGLPPLMSTEVVEPIGPYCPSGTGRKDRSKYGSAKRGDDRKNRSKTFPGIAKAMADQWTTYLQDFYSIT